MVPAVEQVRTALQRSWQCRAVDGIVAMAGSAWRVDIGPNLFVAKRVVPRQRARFEAGLRAAERVERSGVAAGEPVRTVDGALAVADDDGVLALLRWVPGRPLYPADPLDQQWWGSTLAAAHRALSRFTHPGLAQVVHLVRVDAPHLDLEPWLRPAVREAVAALRRLCVTDQLTYGVVHGEPAAEDFRLDPETGRVGLVEWGSAGTGPLVYDVACAVQFAGGPDDAGELLDGYLSAGILSPEECEAALPTMLRFRAAVRADRCAERLHAGVGDHTDRAELAAVGAELAAYR